MFSPPDFQGGAGPPTGLEQTLQAQLQQLACAAAGLAPPPASLPFPLAPRHPPGLPPTPWPAQHHLPSTYPSGLPGIGPKPIGPGQGPCRGPFDRGPASLAQLGAGGLQGSPPFCLAPPSLPQPPAQFRPVGQFRQPRPHGIDPAAPDGGCHAGGGRQLLDGLLRTVTSSMGAPGRKERRSEKFNSVRLTPVERGLVDMTRAVFTREMRVQGACTCETETCKRDKCLVDFISRGGLIALLMASVWGEGGYLEGVATLCRGVVEKDRALAATNQALRRSQLRARAFRLLLSSRRRLCRKRLARGAKRQSSRSSSMTTVATARLVRRKAGFGPAKRRADSWERSVDDKPSSGSGQ
eukprot:evm.model.scf_858.9 EVM.evm.TU.scf_858.9   scf_858:55258-56316(-)